jgi:hypothetical protein
MAASQVDPPPPTYEPYRPPPVISHERINPFDKNKTPTYDNKTSGIYSSLSSNTSVTSVIKDEKPAAPIEPIVTKPPIVPYTTISSGFDYSYKPPIPLPTYKSKDSIERQDSKPSEVTVVKASESRHKFERKLSDADIIFGSKPEPYTSSFKYENYSRNRSNSSFTSTSTDSDYGSSIYGARKDNPFQKSMSVSSDKDGDFSHDPKVLDSRAYQGISNDAFSDYDSPKSTTTANRSWSNNDDDEYDLK